MHPTHLLTAPNEDGTHDPIAEVIEWRAHATHPLGDEPARAGLHAIYLSQDGTTGAAPIEQLHIIAGADA